MNDYLLLGMSMVTADFVDFFLEATEAAAVAASPWRGKGDGKAADGAAVEAMRAVFDKVPFDGRVAIGAVSYTHLTLPTSYAV